MLPPGSRSAGDTPDVRSSVACCSSKSFAKWICMTNHIGNGRVTRRFDIGGVSREALLIRLKNAQVQLNDSAKTLFASELFATSAVRRQVDTIELAVRDLGFLEGATMPQLQMRAFALGLCLPPFEAAPHLRLQYLDQPEGSLGYQPTTHRAPPGSLTVASAPVSGDHDFPKGFYLRRIEGDLWLRGYRSDLAHRFDPADRIILCTPEEKGDSNAEDGRKF